MSSPPRMLTADRGDAGRRLDLVVRRRLAGIDQLTRTAIQKAIARGQVTVNGVTTWRTAARVALGDVVGVLLPPGGAARRPMAPEALRLDILHEDDHLLVVDKPAGMVAHPTYRHANGTLMNALLWHARGWPDGQRPTLVGRLDMLTTGLVIVAKTSAVHALLQRETTSGRADKDYLAVVHGCVNVVRGRVDLRLSRDARDRRRVIASATSGRASQTQFERLSYVKAPPTRLALLRCRLVTGRTHQIRVHLAARGWPIVGDPMYGQAGPDVSDRRLADVLQAFPRQALHAWRATLRHPVTGRGLSLEAPLPRDLYDLLTEVGLCLPE